ncbi:MAG TPA: ABC transporter permease subunit [Streptosporangiaceae bacterium]|nr:ABC transporter permease subunit [Streptosporangiaceae bacterium]
MLTQESQPRVPADAGPQGPGQKVRISRFTPAGLMTVAGAAAGALGLVWVLYERVLPLSGVPGFWLSWYVVFLLFYVAMARMQWDWREVSHRLATVAFVTGGTLAIVIVLGQVVFTLLRGSGVVIHGNFYTQSMAFAGPLSPLTSGGVLHAMVGTVEQIAIATIFSVPLAVATGLFLAEVGGAVARPVRVIVEAMTALPDIIAGLFVYALFILTLGLQKSGLAASIALSVTMIPIIARASEVVLRLVPGTLREAAYALGASQWRTVWNVVLSTARSGLATAVVLGMARGIGETAPVLVVTGVTKEMNFDPLQGPQMSLPLFIYNYAHTEAGKAAYIARGFGAGFALVLVVLLLFTIARMIGGSAPGQLSRRQRRRLGRQAAQG